MPVSGQQTFSDLRLIDWWQVTTLCVNSPLLVGKLWQFSLPSLHGQLMSSSSFIYMDYKVDHHQRQTRAAYGCLVAGQSPWARAWTTAYRLYARSVCDTKKHRCSMPLVARYVLYVFALLIGFLETTTPWRIRTPWRRTEKDRRSSELHATPETTFRASQTLQHNSTICVLKLKFSVGFKFGAGAGLSMYEAINGNE